MYWRLRYEWQVHYLLPLLVFVPLFWFFWPDPYDNQNRPSESVASSQIVTAKITGISNGGSKYSKPQVEQRVSAMTAEGAAGSISVFPKEIAGCEVGDPIRAEQRGIRLYLKPEPCADAAEGASE